MCVPWTMLEALMAALPHATRCSLIVLTPFACSVSAHLLISISSAAAHKAEVLSMTGAC
jgi:hypothetical protein